MIGLHTNALIRLLTQDDAAQAASVRKRLAPLDAVSESVLLNNVVLVETLWTLRRIYGFERAALQDLMEHLLSARTFCFEDRATVTQAVALFASTAADFSDCLIATQNARLGCECTVTFDKGMSSLPQVEVLRTRPA
ncbi:PIN domain-containing protein [Rhodoferax sp.]|uniref:PIN domain-containing protein n=1 Tax=Rhodoferax sp. TaxID=50421 RepID=UPI002761A3A4|nr:type II toxin-antitoxin system VapC family toxin [Rhodoferax sp.]